MEHRWGKRLQVKRPVRLRRTPGLIGWGVLRDVSLTGAFVETSLPLPPLGYVDVELMNAPGASERFAAFVVRQTREGAGLEWCEPFEDIAGLSGCFSGTASDGAPVRESPEPIYNQTVRQG